jgi:hypothetical protein
VNHRTGFLVAHGIPLSDHVGTHHISGSLTHNVVRGWAIVKCEVITEVHEIARRRAAC